MHLIRYCPPHQDMETHTVDAVILQHTRNFLMQDDVDIAAEMLHHHQNEDFQPDGPTPGQLPSQYQPVTPQPPPPGQLDNYLDTVVEMLYHNQGFQPDSHVPGQLPSHYQPQHPPGQSNNHLDTVVEMVHYNQDFQPDNHVPDQLPSQYQPAAPQFPPGQSDEYLDTVVDRNQDFQPDTGQLPAQYQPAAPQLPPHSQSDPFPMQEETQLGARSDALPQCPECGRDFNRTQERDRHLRTFLPHWFFCPFEGCPWRGDRVCNLKTHCLTHANWEAPEPEPDDCKIYNPDPLVQLVAGGDFPMEEAQAIALQEVQRRAQELGKVGIWTDFWGRRQRVQH